MRAQGVWETWKNSPKVRFQCALGTMKYDELRSEAVWVESGGSVGLRFFMEFEWDKVDEEKSLGLMVLENIVEEIKNTPTSIIVERLEKEMKRFEESGETTKTGLYYRGIPIKEMPEITSGDTTQIRRNLEQEGE